MKGYGALTHRVLEILANGFVLSLSKDRQRRFELHQQCDKLWYSIDRKQLYHVLRRLRLNDMIKTIQRQNNAKIILNKKGKTKWLKSQFDNLELKTSKRWNKKWRIVLFDIPETQKKIRDSFRQKLKDLGFLEFQKSVFIYPFSCQDEINFVINYLGIEERAYYLEAPISPDHNFRKHFKLK